MRYIKLFEKKVGPKIGDYVICEDFTNLDLILKNFIKEHIGQIVSKSNYSSEDISKDTYIYVKYDELNPNDNIFIHRKINYPINFDQNEIIHYGTKDDMEAIMTAKKYNL